MDWFLAFIVLAWALCLLIFAQGISLLLEVTNPGYVRWFGMLTVVVGCLCAIAITLFFSGNLVLSPEFGLAIAQGNVGQWGLALLVFLLPITVGLAWHIGRTAAGQMSQWRWLLGIGFLVGVLSVSHISGPLDPEAPEPISVYYYDLWWTPLVLWLILSLLENAFSILRLGSTKIRLWAAVGATVAIAIYALSRHDWVPDFGDGSTEGLWFIALLVGPLALAFWGVWSLVRSRVSRSTKVFALSKAIQSRIPAAVRGSEVNPTEPESRTRQIILLLALAGVALSIVSLFYQLTSLGNIVALTGFTASWIVLTIVVAQGPLYRFFQALRHSELFDPNSEARRELAAITKPFGALAARPINSFRGFLNPGSWPAALLRALIIVIVLIVLGELPNAGKTLIQPFKISGLTDKEDVRKNLSDTLTDRVLSEIRLLNLRMQLPVLIPTSSAGSVTLSVPTFGSDSINAALASSNEIDIGGVKIPLGLLVGSTQGPAQWLLNVRAINGTLQAEPDQYSLIAFSTSGETWLANYALTQPFSLAVTPTITGQTSSASMAFLQKDNLNLIIQQSDGKIQFMPVPFLLKAETNPALSTNAFTMQVKSPDKSLSIPVTLTLQTPQTLEFASGTDVSLPVRANGLVTAQLVLDKPIQLAWPKQEFSMTLALNKGTSSTLSDISTDAINQLAEEIAFRILASSPNLVANGMTKSWEAFQPFRDGLDRMDAYLATDDYDALGQAIADFRKATLIDASFALAYYHLGLALEKDGQPNAALLALRACLKSNPDFIPGYNAIAYYLYYFRNYYPYVAAVLPQFAEDQNIRGQHINEARKAWQQVLVSASRPASVPDRASAYAGLCVDALDRNSYYIAYFYCKRAELLYTELSAVSSADPQIKEGEGYALDALGVVLASKAASNETTESADWNCATFTIVQDKLSADGSIAARSLMRGPYAKQALEHYERALSFSPNDAIIRCNVADAEYVAGQKLAMQQLENDSSYRSYLGNSYFYSGKEAAFGNNPSVASGYFHLAMKEFDAALSIDPLNIGALNEYGYTYWTWKLLAARAKVSENPDAQIGESAERYARGAYAQAKDKLPKSSEMSYLSTLWEVLLARGHPEDAITQLAPLMKDNLVSNSPYTDEMRWDMAQAYLCAAAHAERNADSPQTAQQRNDQARFYLDAIKQQEASRDLQSFGRDPSLLDATVLSACFQ